MSTLTIAGFPFLESKSVLADYDRLLLSDSQTNMWNQKQIAWVELVALLAGPVESVNGYTGEVVLDIFDLDDVPAGPSAGTVLTWNGSALVWVPAIGASGETNLMSNVGTGAALGVYKQKTSVTFELNGILGKEGVASTLSGNNIELSLSVATLTNTQKTDLTAALISDIRAGISVEQLNNTTITAAATNDVLTWNGSIWVNSPVSALTFNLNSLSAVTTGTAANDYAVIYSASLGAQRKITLTNLATLMGVAADASTTVKGMSKLSVAPAISNTPIAVGDNDPRMSQLGYDAIVAASGGTHTTLSSAVNAGKQRILITSGTYADVPPSALSVGKNLYIDCEGSVIMNIDATGIAFCFSVNGARVHINGGTWNVTQNQVSFSFLYTTSTTSILKIENAVINNILNLNSATVYVTYTGLGSTDTFSVTNSRILCTLGTATVGCTLSPAESSFAEGVFNSCVFYNQNSSGTLNASNGNTVTFVGCRFYANGSGTVKNTLSLSNATHCIGLFSKSVTATNCSHCEFQGSNMAADATYDFGTSSFRMNASGYVHDCTFTSSFTASNGISIGGGSHFTDNTISGGQHHQVGSGSATYTAGPSIRGNTWTIMTGGGSNTTFALRDGATQFCNNNIHTNQSSGGAETTTITVEATADYSQVCNNIVISDSGVLPTISDLGTGSTVADNVLIGI